MGSKHSMAGWFAIAAIAAMVAGGVAFAGSASESMRLPRGDIEPLAVSPEAYRYATLREAAWQWAHELDRAVAGLQEQAVVERADARQARALLTRARALGVERGRVTMRAFALGRGPREARAGAAEAERFAAWLRHSAAITPEASHSALERLRLALGSPQRPPVTSTIEPVV